MDRRYTVVLEPQLYVFIFTSVTHNVTHKYIMDIYSSKLALGCIITHSGYHISSQLHLVDRVAVRGIGGAQEKEVNVEVVVVSVSQAAQKVRAVKEVLV